MGSGGGIAALYGASINHIHVHNFKSAVSLYDYNIYHNPPAKFNMLIEVIFIIDHG